MPESAFSRLYRRVIELLEEFPSPYLIVGGLATGVLGEPRLTHDVDVIAGFKKKETTAVLGKAREKGFLFDENEVSMNIRERGTFRLRYDKSWVDIIIASTELEQSAFNRAKRVRILGIEANYPSPEDFILFKLIPGRPKDLLDVEAVVLRHGGNLDKSYLERWARKISDEMEDHRVIHSLKSILKNPPLGK